MGEEDIVIQFKAKKLLKTYKKFILNLIVN